MLSQTHHQHSTTTTTSSLRRLHRYEMDGAGFEKKGGNELLGFAFGDDVDDFSVDDLLDFPETNENEAAVVGCDDGGGVEDGERFPCVSVKLEGVVPGGGGGGGFDFAPSEISVPADDVAELEWLSHFVDDSFTEYSLAYPGVNLMKVGNSPPPATVDGGPLFPRPVKKPRGKRSRSAGKSWSRSASDTTSSSSSSGSTSTFTSSPKRQRRGLEGGARRCSHCGVQKTPQWRAGPEGAKTLCNACGVRFKSGRLCPEYRPACSPTFCSELHSNKHRKVVEMRRKKEVVTAVQTAVSCLAPVV